jgi:WG containing repeat
MAPAQHADHYGIIDIHGQWLFDPILAVAWDILGGLMVAKTNGKFLNTTFEWVIAPIYNEVWDCDRAFLRTAMYPLETRSLPPH